jgi:hypothetical protein
MSKTLKELLLADDTPTREAVEDTVKGLVYQTYISLLTLRQQVNQTVEQVAEPYVKQIERQSAQLTAESRRIGYLKRNPWWKRVWLALVNDYSLPAEGE